MKRDLAADGGTDEAGPDWDPDLYDGSHSYVHEYGADVVSLLSPEPNERILDLGCGTGHLAARIADAGAAVVAVDADGSMVGQARETYPTLDLVRGDARALPFAGAFDAVFSNAALHWVPARGHDAVAASVADALRDGGRFVAEFGGRGNVDAIVGALREALGTRGREVETPWYFPSVGEYASILERRGLSVTYARLFDRPTEIGGEGGLRDWLRMFGGAFLDSLDPGEREAVVEEVETALRSRLYDEGTWTADYRRLRIVAEKSGGR